MPENRPRTAVVLETDLLLLHRLREVLRRAGYRRVLPAADGAEVLTLMAAELVHLVLVPWDAPGLSGLELLRATRRRGQNRDVPVIILDHGLPQQTVVAAIKAGAAGRLPMPPEPAALAEILSDLAARGRTGPGPDELPC